RLRHHIERLGHPEIQDKREDQPRRRKEKTDHGISDRRNKVAAKFAAVDCKNSSHKLSRTTEDSAIGHKAILDLPSSIIDFNLMGPMGRLFRLSPLQPSLQPSPRPSPKLFL